MSTENFYFGGECQVTKDLFFLTSQSPCCSGWIMKRIAPGLQSTAEIRIIEIIACTESLKKEGEGFILVVSLIVWIPLSLEYETLIQCHLSDVQLMLSDHQLISADHRMDQWSPLIKLMPVSVRCSASDTNIDNNWLLLSWWPGSLRIILILDHKL